MFTKTHIALLASAILSANGALAANHHRHAQRHQLHMNDKKALVPETTTTVTDITWVTVTVNGDEAPAAPTAADVEAPAAPVTVTTSSTSTGSSTASSSTPPSSSSTPTTTVVPPTVAPVAPTTLQTTTAAASIDAGIVAVAAPVTTLTPTTTAAPVSTPASSDSNSKPAASGNKRGAAYNDPSLVSHLLGTDSKVGWSYNWGSASDGLTSDVEYVPMLWGQKMVSYWATNAQAAIDAGSKYLLGPNEPDNAGQANMDPATAATFHMTNMEPFAGKAILTAPAVTNSNTPGESLDWLSEFNTACSDCTFSVCPVHWYNTIEAGAEDLFTFLLDAGTTCGSGKTVWLTEFAPNVDNPSADQISSFLETVQDTLDNNATFSFVERYAYFYVAEGSLLNGGSLTTFGNTFAFGA